MPNFDPTVNSDFGPPVSLCDVTGRRVLVGDDYAKLLVIPKDELVGRPWQSSVHADDLSKRDSSYQHLIATGAPFVAPWRVLRGDGTWVSITIMSSRIMDKATGRLFLQGNLCPDPDHALPGTDSLVEPLSCETACAEYISAMAHELSEMAGEQNMPLLQHFLSMAKAEAVSELHKRMTSGRSIMFDLSHALH